MVALSIRNNNPGNLRYAEQPGATEDDAGFAVFPDPETGMNAMGRQIFKDTQERQLPLGSLIRKYAPPEDDNDTASYVNFITGKTGLPADSSIPPDQLEALQLALIQMEGGEEAVEYFTSKEPEAEVVEPALAGRTEFFQPDLASIGIEPRDYSAPLSVVRSRPEEKPPSLVSFRDSQQFRDLIQDKGVAGVAREVSGLVNNLLGSYDFTYEQLKNGTADILQDLPATKNRKEKWLRDEEILAYFTNVETYGKYDPPTLVPVMNQQTGEQKVDPKTGALLFEEPFSPELRAMGAAIQDTAAMAAFSVPGALIGARTGAMLAAPLGPFGVAAGVAVGGLIGGAGLAGVGGFFDDLIFDDPDDIVIPSLQSWYNMGETGTYAVTFLATPAVALKTPLKSVADVFQGGKFLKNFKEIASQGFDPKKITGAQFKALDRESGNILGEKGVMQALQAGVKKPPKRWRFDPKKGPVSTRLATSLIEGSTKHLQSAATNPTGFLGWEALFGGLMSGGAFLAEEVAPNNMWWRLAAETGAPIASLPTGRATLWAAGKAWDGIKTATAGGAARQEALDKGRKALETFVGTTQENEAAARIYKYITTHPEFEAADGDPEKEIEAFIDIIVKPQPGDENLTPASSVRKQLGKDNPRARILLDLERELFAQDAALTVSRDENLAQFHQEAWRKIQELNKTGQPDAIRLAAMLEQSLMEDQIRGSMQKEIQQLDDALAKVYGEGEIPKDRIPDIAEKMFVLVQKSVRATKQRENNLWKAVPDFEIKAFRTPEGEESYVPRMVRIFGEDTKDKGLKFGTAGAEDDFLKALGAYAKDFESIRRRFPGDDLETSVPKALAREEANLKTALNKITGTAYEALPTKLVATARAEGKSVEEIIARLRQEAGKYLGRSSSPQRRATAKALNAQADLLAAARAPSKRTDDPSDWKPLTLSFLQEIRSSLGNKIKDLETGLNPNTNAARHLRHLKNAIDEDLLNIDVVKSLENTPRALQAPDVLAAYGTAKSYTLGRNNVFERSFLGKLSRTRSGGQRLVDPEDSFSLVTKGGNLRLARIAELRRAAQAVDDPTEELVTDIKGFESEKFKGVTELDYIDPRTGERVVEEFDPAKQERDIEDTVTGLIRNLAKKLTKKEVDPTSPTGDIKYSFDPKKLAEYRQSAEAEKLFSVYPTLAIDLADAQRAQALLNSAEILAKQKRNEPGHLAFKLFLDSDENTTEAMTKIIEGQTLGGRPIATARTLKGMVERIRKNGAVTDPKTNKTYSVEDQLNGMRASIFNYAGMVAGNYGIKPMDAQKFTDVLFSRLKSVEDPDFNLMKFMRDEGLIDEKWEKDLKQYLREITDTKEAFSTGDLDPILFKGSTMGRVAAIKIMGAMAVGATLNKVKKLLKIVNLEDFGIGAGVVAGGEGAKMAKTHFITAPQTLLVSEMTRIINNKEVLALALKRARSRAEQNEIIDQMNTILGANVVRRLPIVRRETGEYLEDYSDEEKEAVVVPRLEPPPEEVEREEVKAYPPMPPTAFDSMMSAAPPPTPVPTSQPVAQGPVDRQRFAALFPNDLASGIIRSRNQGIGSLMG